MCEAFGTGDALEMIKRNSKPLLRSDFTITCLVLHFIFSGLLFKLRLFEVIYDLPLISLVLLVAIIVIRVCNLSTVQVIQLVVFLLFLMI